QHVIGLGDSNAAPFKHRLCIVGQGVLGELPSKGAGEGTERRHYFEAAGFLVKMANSHPLIAFGLQIQEELHWLAESPARVSQRCIYLAALHTRCDFYKVVLEVLLENSSYFDELCIAGREVRAPGQIHAIYRPLLVACVGGGHVEIGGQGNQEGSKG